MWPMALLVAGYRQDLKALFVMNVLCAMKRKYYLKWIEFSEKIL